MFLYTTRVFPRSQVVFVRHSKGNATRNIIYIYYMSTKNEIKKYMTQFRVIMFITQYNVYNVHAYCVQRVRAPHLLYYNSIIMILFRALIIGRRLYHNDIDLSIFSCDTRRGVFCCLTASFLHVVASLVLVHLIIIETPKLLPLLTLAPGTPQVLINKKIILCAFSFYYYVAALSCDQKQIKTTIWVCIGIVYWM